jgi:hypothetical protein
MKYGNQGPVITQTHPKPITKKNSVARVRRRELYRPSDRRLSAKLVPTLEDRGYYVVSATTLNPYLS